MTKKKYTEDLYELTYELAEAYSNALEAAGLAPEVIAERKSAIQDLMEEVRNAGFECLRSKPRIMEGVKLRVVQLLPNIIRNY